MTAPPRPAPAPCEPCEPCHELLHAAHVGVLRALEVAGKRLVTRARRGEMLPHPAWTRHTLIPVEQAELDRLLDGVWTLLSEAIPGRPDVLAVCDEYCRQLLVSGTAHELRFLRIALQREGITP